MKRIFIPLFALLIAGIINGQTPDFDWALNFGSTGLDYAVSINTDQNGNVYTTGSYRGTVDFDPGPGILNLTAGGGSDAFIQKLDPSGNLVWALSFGNTGSDQGRSVAIDGSGNIYVTGYFRYTVDFDPGTGIANHTSATSSDVFVLKLDPNGNYIWSKSFAGRPEYITVDASNNVYTTGYFLNTVDFDPGTGVYNLTSNGGSDVFIHKLDASGNFVWARAFGAASSDVGRSVEVDNTGNVYVAGNFNQTVDFDPGVGTLNITSAGASDIFIEKLNATGNLVWAKTCGGTGNDIASDIKLDNADNIITAGFFDGTVDFDPGLTVANLTCTGTTAGYIQKLDPSGNFTWVKGFMGGASTYDYIHDIALDADQNIYATGLFNGTIDFDPNGGVNTLTTASTDAISIHKIDNNGNYVWAQKVGDPSGEGISIDVDVNNDVLCTGSTGLTADFDPTSGVFNLTSAGSYDVFVLKLWQCTTQYATINPSACTSYTSPSGNYTWTTSNTYLDTLTAVGGCDSIITINLTITGSSTGTDIISACNTYQWIDGNWYTANNNTATHTIVGGASNGCDSVVTLNLTMNYTATSTDVITACNTYQWIDGNTYTSSNNTATHTITGGAANGCDSVVTLNLTMNYTTTGTDVITACNTYQWIDGNTYTSSNNTATHTITGGAANGCDSIVTLNLTINATANGTDVITACDSYQWIDGTTYTSSNNTATHTLTGGAANGCDSVVTLDLTINTVNVAAVQQNDSITASATGATYQWLDCNNNYAVISGATNQLFVATANGSYAVEVTENGCTDTSSCYTVIGIGIADIGSQMGVLIAPNPFSEATTILFDQSLNGEYDLLVFDLVGKEVVRKQRITGNSIRLQKNELGEGVYLAYLINYNMKQRVFIGKLIVQ